MKRTDEATWKESFSINYRALGLWRKMAGRFLLALTLSTALEALAPYIPLVFTARLLDEIAGARDPARLTTLCVLLLSISTLTLLLAAACKHWCTAEEETNSYREAQQFFTKLLQMDFCAVDDAKTHDLLSQIRQNETWSGWGLPRVPEEYQTLLRGLIKIVCSAALSVSLFLKPVRAGFSHCVGQPSRLYPVCACLTSFRNMALPVLIQQRRQHTGQRPARM